MEVPLHGNLTKDTDLDWYVSEEKPINLLNGQGCKIILEAYEEDPNQDDFHKTIANFLEAGQELLQGAEKYIFEYYQDTVKSLEGIVELPKINNEQDIWEHIDFGNEIIISRRSYGDKQIYVSMEWGCAWEQEHGLQIVLKNGNSLAKVSSFDGHSTNSDSYADPSLEDVIYVPLQYCLDKQKEIGVVTEEKKPWWKIF